MRSLSPALIRGRAGRRDRESGSTAVEFVIWTPLLFFILIALVQLALYLFAEHVADTAAQAGARAGRQDEPGDPGNWQVSATNAADSWVDNFVGQGITGVVTTDPVLVKAPNVCTPPIITVQVSFTMSSLFGGMHVHAQSEGPVENFYPTGC